MKKTTYAVLIGNVLEWFDFAVYGYFASSIGNQFFPVSNHLSGLSSAFAVFALGFVGRVGGGLLFGIVSKRSGRPAALRASILLMAGSSAALALLPTYRQVGLLAPFLLILMRLLQGLSLGGEFTTSLTFLASARTEMRPGFRAGLLGSAGVIGFILSSLLGALLTTFLPWRAVDFWGWRILFLVGSSIGLSAFFLRREMDDAALLCPERSQPPVSPWPTIRDVPAITATALGCTLYMLGFYLIFVYLPTGLSSNTHLPLNGSLSLISGALLILAFAAPVAGIIADALGTARLLIISATILALVAVPIFSAMESGRIVLILTGLVALVLLFAPIHAVAPLPFIARYADRGQDTAFSVGFNVAAVGFGGLAPLMATWSTSTSHHLSSCGLLVLGAAALSVCGWVSVGDRQLRQYAGDSESQVTE